MTYRGILNKMNTEITNESVNYTLLVGNDKITLNNFIGEKIKIEYLQQINCIHCGRKTKTSYAQGFCYNCFRSLPETGENIMNPELDMAHLGVSRDMEWAKEVSLKKHFVYLANTGEIKVGVTRASQIPTRWIDQGADNAIIIAEAPNRHIAGTIEVYLKKYFNDKTKWKKMLSQENTQLNILEQKNKAFELLHPEFKQYFLEDTELMRIKFPVKEYPEHILQNINLEKAKTFKGTLAGIKGQYLIFNTGDVINIRKHAGFNVVIDFD
jgi:hypothetical protein